VVPAVRTRQWRGRQGQYINPRASRRRSARRRKKARGRGRARAAGVGAYISSSHVLIHGSPGLSQGCDTGLVLWTATF